MRARCARCWRRRARRRRSASPPIRLPTCRGWRRPTLWKRRRPDHGSGQFNLDLSPRLWYDDAWYRLAWIVWPQALAAMLVLSFWSAPPSGRRRNGPRRWTSPPATTTAYDPRSRRIQSASMDSWNGMPSAASQSRSSLRHPVRSRSQALHHRADRRQQGDRLVSAFRKPGQSGLAKQSHPQLLLGHLSPAADNTRACFYALRAWTPMPSSAPCASRATATRKGSAARRWIYRRRRPLPTSCFKGGNRACHGGARLFLRERRRRPPEEPRDRAEILSLRRRQGRYARPAQPRLRLQCRPARAAARCK